MKQYRIEQAPNGRIKIRVRTFSKLLKRERTWFVPDYRYMGADKFYTSREEAQEEINKLIKIDNTETFVGPWQP